MLPWEPWGPRGKVHRPIQCLGLGPMGAAATSGPGDQGSHQVTQSGHHWAVWMCQEEEDQALGGIVEGAGQQGFISLGGVSCLAAVVPVVLSRGRPRSKACSCVCGGGEGVFCLSSRADTERKALPLGLRSDWGCQQGALGGCSSAPEQGGGRWRLSGLFAWRAVTSQRLPPGPEGEAPCRAEAGAAEEGRDPAQRGGGGGTPGLWGDGGSAPSHGGEAQPLP